MSLLLKEKEVLVIKLAKEGKTTRDMAKIVHVSLLDIGKIIARETGDAKNLLGNKEKENNKNQSLTMLKLFKCSEKRKV